jgi:putative phage-type endonuclease
MTASDQAALQGESPYRTRRDVWFEKAGLGEPDDEDRSFIFRRGHETEAELRELFSAHTKLEITPTCFEKGAIYGASLDGYDKSLGVFEAKLVGKDVLKTAKEKREIPEHHWIQIQAQLHASDSDKGFWGGMAPKIKGGVVVEFGRDDV